MIHEEGKIQYEIVQALNALDCYCFYIKNEGKKNMRQAMRDKAMGLRSGVADLCVLTANGTVFLEVKTEKGKQSDNQKRFQEIAIKYGCNYFVVRSAKEAFNIIKGYV
jgi:hypothetical protein